MEIIDTIGSDFDTLMAVYTGNAVSNLTRVAADDDSGGNKASRVSFQAQAGTTYHIAVDGYNTSGLSIASGKVELNWNPPCQLAVVSADPVRLSLTGGYGWYSLESSTDLQTWQTVSTFYVGQSVYYFQDSRNLPWAYYRAVLTPSP